jgi:TatD DNase family protein
LIDSHTHLTYKHYRRDLEQVLGRARDAGVTAFITVGYDVRSSEAGIEIAEKHDDVFAAVGVHPHDAKCLDAAALGRLEELADHPKVVAVGEIGLDYYRDLSPRHVQEQAFIEQIGLAKKKGLPVIVHDREAHAKTVAVLKQEGVRRGVLHCFSGDINMARQAIGLGLHISFAGPVTYGGKRAVDVIRWVAEDRIMVETDCPYLAPVPFRGKRNEPAYVRYVVERIAEVLGKSSEEVDRTTEANTRLLFAMGTDPAL